MPTSVSGNQALYTFSRHVDGTLLIAEKADPSIVVTAALGEEITFTGDGSILSYYEYFDDSVAPPVLVSVLELLEGTSDITWTGTSPVELYGLDGADIYKSGADDDYIDGGNGIDTVIATGNMADYTFEVTPGINLGMDDTSGTDGYDVFRDIEKFQYADGTITVHDTTAKLEDDYNTLSEPPTITTLADGTQVIVWKQDTGIRVQHRNGDQVLSDDILASTGSAVEPVVSALNDGFVVSWTVNSEVNSSSLFTQVFDQNAGSVALHEYVVPNLADRWDLSTVALENGGYVIAWTEETQGGGAPDKAYVQTFDANGVNTSTPVALATGISSYPSVSALHNGGFVAVWENEDAKGNEEIYLQRFTEAGAKDGKAVQVNTGTTGGQYNPEVVTLDDGSFVVSWTRETTQSNNIFMQRYSETGTKLGAETQVNTTNGFYGESSVTALTTGGYVVTWATSDDTETANGTSFVYAQMFDKNGAKVGIELIVAKSSHHDFYPAITATAEGGFAVAWESYNLNAENDGNITYKIFDAQGNFRTLTGDDGDNTLNWSGTVGVTLDGGLGDDHLNGGDAADLLIGGVGADALSGGKGNDIYVVDDENDVVTEQLNQGTDTVRSSVSYALADNVENLTLTGTADINATGNNLNNVITGNAGNNQLYGGAGADTLIGGEGDDLYLIDDTKDTIVEKAGEGSETVFSSVTWTLGANLENLVLNGAAAINGTGNALANNLLGNSGKNTLNGGDGDDTLDGAAGADALVGGKGSDTFKVDLVLKGTGAKAVVALEDTVTEAANVGDIDTLILRGGFSTDAATTLTLGANLETFDASLTGTTKLNLTGNALANTLIGNAADNVLNGGAGIDTLIGGDGNDTYVVDNVAELGLIEEGIGEGIDLLRVTYKGGVTTPQATINLGVSNLVNVERVEVTGTGLYTLVGNDRDNTLDAGKTASLLLGGKGNDVYFVAHKDAQVVEDDANGDDGVDTVVASVSFAIGDNVENLTLTGKAAINGTGNELENQIIGNDGANILDGGTGADTLTGGKGNDTYIVDDANDVVSEDASEGTDLIKASISFDLGNTPYVENLTLTGSDDINATGNDGANTLTGNSVANTLDGGAGVDKLLGGAGEDTYIVDLIAKGSGAKATVALQDTITENKGEGDHDTVVLRADSDLLISLSGATKATTLTLANYLENIDASGTGTLKLNLTGNAASNEITGNDAANVLNGGAGDDIIDGGDGADVIIGGLGADTLTGGAGADSFTFTSLKELGLDATQDVITDFTSGEDTLNFKALKGWTFNASATEATGTKQLWAVSDGVDTYVYGNSGGTPVADFAIKLVGVTAPLTSADFVLA
ncbi:beta strand repeat-containing protein [Pseudomonas turukhanskensis]|uniref:Calcium-binding protein n=1 Tax=Pseudomonas turukhanskensis TaxID=1806536 RepID=A0A9W6K792_9PSED|nr:calcium-binding protein [Pseudomonas turukhanskensis]GLK90810.1 hypothetical protein GCM10017655_38740 [Pseudomonas turukhanskensis]